MQIEQVLFRPKVVAHLFGVSDATIRNLCQQGRIPAVNLGSFTHSRWMVPLSFVQEAMRGAARWKYPRALKRQCVSRRVAQRRIAQVNDEMARIARNETNWEDEDDE